MDMVNDWNRWYGETIVAFRKDNTLYACKVMEVRDREDLQHRQDFHFVVRHITPSGKTSTKVQEIPYSQMYFGMPEFGICNYENTVVYTYLSHNRQYRRGLIPRRVISSFPQVRYLATLLRGQVDTRYLLNNQIVINRGGWPGYQNFNAVMRDLYEGSGMSGSIEAACKEFVKKNNRVIGRAIDRDFWVGLNPLMPTIGLFYHEFPIGYVEYSKGQGVTAVVIKPEAEHLRESCFNAGFDVEVA